jgi:diguanylate cyclase (GGDEF)-like protein
MSGSGDRILKMLVVDDDDDDLYLIKDALNDVKGTVYRVSEATSALSAMGILARESFDVILSDYRLGPVTGIDYIKNVRAAGIDTPIILLTGMPDYYIDEEALRAGASDFLPKLSIAPEVIDRSVRYALAHAERQRLLQAVLKSTISGVVVLDKQGEMSLWNPRFTEFAQAAFPGDAKCLLSLTQLASKATEKDVVLGEFVVEVYKTELNGGGTVLALHDVTTRVNDLKAKDQAEQRIRKIAMHDGLTGLPNRMAFNEFMDDSITNAQTANTSLAVLSFDFNRFKEVNDLFGHAAGDYLLKSTANRITALLREGEYAARLGGDEFVLVQQDGNNTSATDLASRLTTELCQHIEFEGRIIEPGISVGIAFYPQHGSSRQDLLANADLAMYRAKSEPGLPVCVFGASIDQYVRERRRLAHDLKSAIQNDEFSPYFQPQFNVKTGELSGLEVLLRWKHPTRGFVPPSEFIPIAEENGLIAEIDEWVLRKSCKLAREWPAVQRFAVNISAKAIGLPSIASTVRSIIAETDMSPSRLELEITETALIQDLGRALHSLRQIKSLGISIAMDDFGTGYSSLSLLNSFPFDRIKIDKSFITTADVDKRAGAIFKSVVGLGTALQVPVLAEGIETEGQYTFTQEAGCEEGQGYLMGKPMSVDQFVALSDAGTKLINRYSVAAAHEKAGKTNFKLTA